MRTSRTSALFAFLVIVLVYCEVLAQQGTPGATPVTGLTPAQQLAFQEGSRVFSKSYTVAEGLGPIYNGRSCVDCHQGAGGANRVVIRFGRITDGEFDPLLELGGSLLTTGAIGDVTTVDGTHRFSAEQVPPEANVRASRRTTSLRGLGYVDAVPDETWMAIARAEAAAAMAPRAA